MTQPSPHGRESRIYIEKLDDVPQPSRFGGESASLSTKLDDVPWPSPPWGRGCPRYEGG
jgi:hypothetical protein